MDNKDFSNIGEQIRNTVEDAMGSMNYQQLNQKINQTVDMALREAKRQFQNYQYGNSQPHVKPPVQQKSQTYSRPREKKQFLRIKPKGKMLSIPMIIFGGISSFVSVIFMTSLAVGAFIGQSVGKTVAFIGLPLALTGLIASLIILGKGISGWNRYLNYKRYVQILDGREFCSVKELAEKTHRTEKNVCKNLKAIIKKGMFVDGFLDAQGTCLIMTREAYGQFQQAQESRRQREAAQAKAQEQKVSGERTAVDEMIEKGNEYIESIRIANDAIPGEVISAKLDRLEMIIRKIFESVKKHPEQMDEMDKFMEYYLPTTEKLVNAYKEFDALPVKGENVTNSMNEIENTLDTISRAFEQLLDDLFQDAAFDISSDISVLQTMLAREGYKEKDFK